MRYLVLAALVTTSGCVCYSVPPGHAGVVLRLGKVSEVVETEGWGFKSPLTSVEDVSLQQQKSTVDAPCFSSDLQQVGVKLTILYRIPAASAVKAFRDYNGNPFDTLIAPRAQEALKEVTALMTAEQIAKNREGAKASALEATRQKVGTLLVIEDLVIENISLSKDLENAIEAKMVQEQEAAKAHFTKQKAVIDAEIAVAKSKGEAEATIERARGMAASISIRGAALKENPNILNFEIVQRWNGEAPSVVGSGTGVSLLLPAAVPTVATGK